MENRSGFMLGRDFGVGLEIVDFMRKFCKISWRFCFKDVDCWEENLWNWFIMCYFERSYRKYCYKFIFIQGFGID